MANIVRSHKCTTGSLARKIAPIENSIPSDSFVRDYGLDTLSPGGKSDLHFHDCDEWWIIVEGRGHVICGDEEGEVGLGDMIFTPMGTKHQIAALSQLTVLWLEGPLRGQRRSGHLYDERT